MSGTRTDRKKRLFSFILALLMAFDAIGLAMPAYAEGDEEEGLVTLSEQRTLTLISGDDDPNEPGTMLFKDYIAQDNNNPTDILTLVMRTNQPFEIGDDAYQLGTEEYPFKGTIIFSDISGATFQATKALFAYISTDAQFLTSGGDAFTGTISVTRVPSETGNWSALFADHVVAGTATPTWNIKCCNDGENNAKYAGVIGVLGEEAELTLNYDVSQATTGAVCDVYSPDNVGLLCGTIKEDATLNATITGSCEGYSVESRYGAAGGLVGVMESGATLRLNSSYSSGVSVTADGESRRGMMLTAAKAPAKKSGDYALEPDAVVAVKGGDYALEPDAVVTVKSGDYAIDADSKADNPYLVSDDAKKSAATTKKGVPVLRSALKGKPIQWPSLNTAGLERGYAGGLVGWAEDATVEVGLELAVTVSGTIEGKGAAAGGLFGYYSATKAATNANLAYTLGEDTVATTKFTIDGSTIKGPGAAGGLFGEFRATAAQTFALDHFSVMATLGGTNEATASNYESASVGGVFGLLATNANVTITDEDFQPNAEAIEFNLQSAFVYGADGGGVIGKYLQTGGLNKSLTIQNLKAKVTDSGSVSMSGGVLGRIDSASTGATAAYVLLQNVGAWSESVTGGLVGDMGDKGSFVDVREYAGLRGSAEGGLVGYAHAGVIRLQGETRLQDDSKLGGGMTTNNGGQLVRERGNALVYAVGSGKDTGTAVVSSGSGYGWAFYRANATRRDDIADWGEVLRLDGTSDRSNSYAPLKLHPEAAGDTILTEDFTAHTVQIAAATTTMGSLADFAKTALNIQLNGSDNPAQGALRFANTTTSASSALLDDDLEITADIDLRGTGLTGFTRDNDATTSDGSGTAYLQFTGTLTGNGKTITLAAGEPYGMERNGSALSAAPANDKGARGAGWLYAHQFVGLFAKTENAAIENLKLGGTINVVPHINYWEGKTINGVKYEYQTWCIGGFSASSTGTLALTDCDAGETVTTAIITARAVRAGGAVGQMAGTGLSVQGGTYAASHADNRNVEAGSAYFGGVVGYVSSGSFTIDIGGTSESQRVTLGGSESGGYDNSGSGAGAIRNSVFYGGLIGYIAGNGAIESKVLNIRNVTVAGLRINAATNEYACASLLGYKWLKTKVVIGTAGTDNAPGANGLTVGAEDDAANSPEMTISGTAKKQGGLVYGATGYWQVHDVEIENATFANSVASAELGLLVCYGAAIEGSSNDATLYLELPRYSTYTLGGVAVSGTSYTTFDELIAYSTKRGSTDIMASDAAVVSVRTTDGLPVRMDTAGCNTYQNQLTTLATANIHSRYYYNLDQIRADTKSGSATHVSSINAEKLLIWSVNKYAHSSIQGYFTNGAIGGSCDMNGLSYYPVTASGVKIPAGTTVKFYNEQIEEREALTTDNLVRSTRTATQHYLMHSGILYDAQNLTVAGLTLQGTVGATNVGPATAGSGFLVRGTLHDSIGKVSSVQNVVLDNALVREGASTPAGTPSGYAPMLINKVGDPVAPTTLTVSGVSTTNYPNNIVIDGASSLIGDVNGANMQLAFSKIKLDARTAALSNATTDAALTSAYSSKQSIFTRATLLNSFVYSDANTNGVYNYDKADDYSESYNVTYGLEINDFSTSGTEFYETYHQEYYFDQDFYTNPTHPANSTAFSFASGWLPYVYSRTGADHHELRINQKSVNVTDGCGKWDDPYLIGTGDQLLAVAKIIRGDAISSNMLLTLPDSLTPNDEHTASGTGSQSNDAAYSLNNGMFGSYTKDAVREYLAGAYYRIVADIALSSDFPGLGAVNSATDAKKYAFRGVIEGEKNANEVYTVTLDTTSPLILNSNGCVVKNLKVAVATPFAGGVAKQDNHASNNTSLTFTYNGGVPAYGAVIGKVMGGDTFIDNVGVDFSALSANSILPNGTAGRLVPVGGYVGVVVNGGVVFRNMSAVPAASALASACNYVSDASWLYVNPIIGRVISGYAFSEGCTVDNGTKNYGIPDLQSSYVTGGMLSFNGSTVTVPGNRALWVLGAILNSGAASATKDSSDNKYKYDASSWGYFDYAAARDRDRTASGNNEYVDYSAYGFVTGVNGYHSCDRAQDKTPYIVSVYTDTSATSARRIGNDATALAITGACDMSRLPGFRGLGNIYSDDAKLQLSVKNASAVQGNSQTVTLNMAYREYDGSKTGENYKATANTAGFGLLNFTKNTMTAKDLTLSGSIVYEIYRNDSSRSGVIHPSGREGTGADNKDNLANTDARPLGVGSLIGYVQNNSVTVDNVDMRNLTLNGSFVVGGLIGKSAKNVTVKKCDGDTLTFTGGLQLGGLLGLANGTDMTITIGEAGETHKLENVTFALNSWRGGKVEGDTYVAGVGGLVGVVKKAKLLVDGYEVSTGSIVSNYRSANETSLAGGVTGIFSEPSSGTKVENFSLIGVSLEAPFAGGAAGMVYLGSAVSFKNVSVKGAAVANSGDAITNTTYIRAQRGAGGLVGFQRTNVAMTVDQFIFSDCDLYILTNMFGNWERDSVGGVVGYVFSGGSDIRNIEIAHGNFFTKAAVDDSSNYYGGAGGLFGYVNGGNVTGCNILLNDLKITNYTDYSSLSYNSNNSVILPSTAPLNHHFGLFAGWKLNNSDLIKLTGVSAISVRNSGTLELKPVGTKSDGTTTTKYGTDGYVIFAYHNGAAAAGLAADPANDTANSKMYINAASNAFTDTSASTVARPYVTVNPAVAISATQKLTSDGTATGADAAAITAAMPISSILTEAGSRYALAYAKSGIVSAMKTTGNNGFELSTYNTEQGITTDADHPDFGVLVINAGESHTNVTRIINSYLDHITNTDYDYFITDASGNDLIGGQSAAGKVFTVSVSRMYYDSNNGVFKSTTSERSLELNTDNSQFRTLRGKADNDRDSFSLIDVAFKDPANTSLIAYHVYVPVFVKKVMEYEFTSNVLSGSTYRAADYAANTDKRVMENYGTPVTICFTYTYKRTKAQWITALEAGDSMMDSFGKELILSKQDVQSVTELPKDTTQVALVDAQTGRVYYAKWSDFTVNGLNLSIPLSASAFSGFQAKPLSDSLNLSSRVSNDGLFVRCNESDTSKQVKIGDYYYRLATDDDTEQHYVIAATDNTPDDISETYYLSIFTDVDAKGIARYTVDCADKLKTVGTGTDYPSRNVSTVANRRSDMILGKIYTITTTVETTNGNDTHIVNKSPQYDTLTVTMDTTVTLNNGAVFKDYAVDMYHSFLVHLTQTDEDGSRTGIEGEPTVSGTYTLNGGAETDYYRNGDTTSQDPLTAWKGSGGYVRFTAAESLKNSLKSSSTGYTATIHAVTQLDYNEYQAAIEAQFPARVTGQSYGTTVFVKSNIATTKDLTPFSPISDRANDGNKDENHDGQPDRAPYVYNSEPELREAKLSYNPKSKVSSAAGDLSELGINPRDPLNPQLTDEETQILVETVGILDYSKVVEQANGYTHLKLSLKLYCKDDNYKAELPLNQYFDSLKVGNSEEIASTFPLKISNTAGNGVIFDDDTHRITIPIDIRVKTGTTFERLGHTYANYKVMLSADLIKVVDPNDPTKDQTLVTTGTDYVIYTNAKIFPDFIEIRSN